jgi:hypothetical protein
VHVLTLTLTGGDAAGMVGDNVDNEIVAVSLKLSTTIIITIGLCNLL